MNGSQGIGQPGSTSAGVLVYRKRSPKKLRPDDPNFVLFRITHGEAHFWKWEDNLKEAAIPRIVF